MKFQFSVFALLITFATSQLVTAGEHPTEHPKPAEETAPTDAHPAAGAADTADTQAAPAEAPQGEPQSKKSKKLKKGKKASEPTSWNTKKVEKDLLAFINTERTKHSGIFMVRDEVKETERKLTLKKIHSDKIVKLKDGTSFVCADFKDANGELVDVDFFMTPTSTGTVENVNKIQVHKVNGAARYTYVQVDGHWLQEAVTN